MPSPAEPELSCADKVAAEVKRDSLQLLVVAALFAAAKFEVSPSREAKLLTAVEFRLCRPTAAHFADRYLQKHACEEEEVQSSSIQGMKRYTPSEQVAAAALVSSRAAAPKREQRVVKCAGELRAAKGQEIQKLLLPSVSLKRRERSLQHLEASRLIQLLKEKRRQLSLERRQRSDLEKEAAATGKEGPKKLTSSALTSVASQEDSFPIRLVETRSGRGLVASRDISKGEVVFRCAPVVAVLHDWALAKYCSRCLKAVGADGTRCPRCRAVTFCKACRQLTAAKLQHRSECPALRRLRSDRPLRRKLHLKKGQGKDATSMMRLALRLLSVRRRSLFGHRSLPLLSDEEGGGGWVPGEDEDVIHDSWEDVEMLTPSEEDLDGMVESLPGWRGQQLEGGANAVRLLFTARRDEIYHLLCRIAFNAMALVPEGPLRSGTRWREKGIALYPSGAMANHSCDPSCLWFVRDGVLVLEAQRRVRRGGELTIAYLSITGNREARQQRLRKAFGFHCACTKCGSEEKGRIALVMWSPPMEALGLETRAATSKGGVGWSMIDPGDRVVASLPLYVLELQEREEQTGKITQVEYSNADALEGFQSNRRRLLICSGRYQDDGTSEHALILLDGEMPSCLPGIAGEEELKRLQEEILEGLVADSEDDVDAQGEEEVPEVAEGEEGEEPPIRDELAQGLAAIEVHEEQ
ncbi:Histone-lysine N-methyltransferase ASHR1 [Symbiodinium microadriaticum]|uniref:Histone-lysine N-methyltransferase ASHR1 n=1 Tax=Symbiodinium microadriaticum TaxID=2951 RepID=A0A1Q9EYS1_SYMMI|nr:Histone-lysine N-methyltransferase ASHR1 [Symbiodinium microadriaticum]